MPWRAPWDPKRAAAATPGLPLRATGEPYRGANVVLLWASQITRGYSKRTWLSFRQAEALGAHVRKGEKATPVIYYGQAKSRETNAATDDNAAKIFRFVKLFHVFNAEQLEDVPDGFAIENAATPPPLSAIDAWADAADARVRVGGTSAYYAPTTDTIHMPPHEAFVSEEHRISTLCHELAHHTGANHRLDRLRDYFTDRTARAKEEMIAEISAAQIGAMIGLKPDHLEDHAAYIADWLTLLRDEPRAFLSAAAKAQAAVDWLIERAGSPGAIQGGSLQAANSANLDLADVAPTEKAPLQASGSRRTGDSLHHKSAPAPVLLGDAREEFAISAEEARQSHHRRRRRRGDARGRLHAPAGLAHL